MPVVTLNLHINYSNWLSLAKDPHSEEQQVVDVLETDTIIFYVLSPETYGKPTVFLQDEIFETATLIQNIKGECLWKMQSNSAPGALANKWFAYHFGLYAPSVEFTQVKQSFDAFKWINILATMQHAKQAAHIIDYLAQKIDNITAICFSTSEPKNTISQYHQKRDIDFLLAHIKNGLALLEQNLPHFRVRRRCRLTPNTRRMPYHNAVHYNEQTLCWVINHLDQLMPADPASEQAFKVENQYYTLQEIESDELSADTDLYENRVILGYLFDIRDFLRNVITFNQNAQRDDRNMKLLHVKDEQDYCSFSEVLRYYSRTKLASRQKECDLLLSQTNACLKVLMRYIPATVHTNIRKPQITPWVQNHLHYRQMFSVVSEWYALGEPFWAAEAYLFGCRSLFKLYEFFCLYRIIDAIEQNAFQATHDDTLFIPKNMFSQSETLNEHLLSHYYCFENQDGVNIRLFYELNIWAAVLNRVMPLDLVDVTHTTYGDFSRWTPDFTLEFRYKEHSYIAIFDAKYSKFETVKQHALPNCIHKYVHGIRRKNGGFSPVLMMYVLHPQDETKSTVTPTYISDNYYSIYGKNYDILSSEHPALPAIGTLTLHPDIDSEYLTILIQKIIEWIKQTHA